MHESKGYMKIKTGVGVNNNHYISVANLGVVEIRETFEGGGSGRGLPSVGKNFFKN